MHFELNINRLPMQHEPTCAVELKTPERQNHKP